MRHEPIVTDKTTSRRWTLLIDELCSFWNIDEYRCALECLEDIYLYGDNPFGDLDIKINNLGEFAITLKHLRELKLSLTPENVAKSMSGELGELPLVMDATEDFLTAEDDDVVRNQLIPELIVILRYSYKGEIHLGWRVLRDMVYDPFD